MRSWFKCPWDCSYSCRVSTEVETDSSCPCVLFIQRFFHSVWWPPLFVAPATYLGGAGSFLAQFRESQSLHVGYQGDESWGAEGCNRCVSAGEAAPCSSECAASTSSPPTTSPSCTGRVSASTPSPGTAFHNTQTHGRAETTNTCVFWHTLHL